MGLVSSLQKVTLVHVWLWTIFLFSSLIVIALQFCTLLIWPFSKKWYRTIIGELLKLFWFQYVWLTEYWCGAGFFIHCKDEDIPYINKEHVILALNHRSDIDWIVIWQLASRFNLLTGGKALMKDELKYVPIMGWSFYLSEQIFVKRDFTKDKGRLLKQLRNLASYHIPTLTVIFCEGTRYTKAKYDQSETFAKDRGIPGLKHHLLPRTKGFTLCVQAYKNQGYSIYDGTIAYSGGQAPSFYDLFCGKRVDCHMYIRRYPVDSVPTETETATSEFCHEMYREKDKAFDYFLQHDTFSGYDKSRPIHECPSTLQTQCIMVFWMAVIGVPIIYYTFVILITGSLMTKIIAVVLFTGVVTFAKAMMNLSQSGKSSSYGLNAVKQQ